MTRRQLLATSAAAIAGVREARALPRPGKRMGLVIHSYWKRWRGKYSSVNYPPFQDALDVLDHIRSIGAGGLQIMVDDWSGEFAGKVRDTREAYHMYLEGSIALPKNQADVPRFERAIRLGKEAGATVFRSAVGGRRYEVFSRLEEFRQFKEDSLKSMQLAEPVARRQGVRIAIENHKDFHAPELAEMLRKVASEHVGSCIDTGNSIALLEDPMAVVEALAPFVATTHIKDMAVQEYENGFLLSEVPCGEGMLDLEKMFQLVERANPKAAFNLEMITRDPLKIPCLEPGYWATFPDKPGSALAAALKMARDHKANMLPNVSNRSVESALAFEEENIVKSFKYCGSSLGLEFPDYSKASNEKDEK